MTDRFVLPAPARRLVALASVVVVLEAAVVVALAVADLASLSNERMAVGVGVGLFLLAYGAGQIIACVLLLRGRTGARGPLVMTQLIQLGIAWNLRGTEAGEGVVPGLAWMLAIGALVVLGCLVSAPVNRAVMAAEDLTEDDSSLDV